MNSRIMILAVILALFAPIGCAVGNIGSFREVPTYSQGQAAMIGPFRLEIVEAYWSSSKQGSEMGSTQGQGASSPSMSPEVSKLIEALSKSTQGQGKSRSPGERSLTVVVSATNTGKKVAKMGHHLRLSLEDEQGAEYAATATSDIVGSLLGPIFNPNTPRKWTFDFDVPNGNYYLVISNGGDRFATVRLDDLFKWKLSPAEKK